MKKNDYILIIIILVIASVSYIGYKLVYQNEGSSVVITVDGKEYGRYNLNQNIVIEIPGLYGINILEIKDEYVDMLSAGCPDQICVSHMKIHYNRETIICLPEKIIVEITDGDDSGLDGVVMLKNGQ